MASLKQGRWVTRVENNDGEPGYQEEGLYKDGKKEGAWTRYNLMGDVIAEENYRWGYKDGVCRYYNLIGILREESWKAIDPLNPYDTVRVYDLYIPDKYDLKVVKVESSSVRHGTWNYYDPERGAITKSEEIVIDQLVSNQTIYRRQDLNDSFNRAKILRIQSRWLIKRNRRKCLIREEKC